MSDKITNECNVCKKNVLNKSFKEDLCRLKMNLRELGYLLKTKDDCGDKIDNDTRTNISKMNDLYREMMICFDKIDFNYLL